MGNRCRSSSSSLNRPRPRAAMQRILHSYLQSACYLFFFFFFKTLRLSVRLGFQSHLCTQEYDSSHSFQYMYMHTLQRSDLLVIFCAADSRGPLFGERETERLFESLHHLFVFTRSFQTLPLGDAFIATTHAQGFSCVQQHFCLSRMTLAGLHEIMSLLWLSTSIKEHQRLLTLKIWTSYLRLQEPFCATPEISHIFPYEWGFPVGGTPTPSSPSQTDGIPRWKQTLALIFPWYITWRLISIACFWSSLYSKITCFYTKFLPQRVATMSKSKSSLETTLPTVTSD